MPVLSRMFVAALSVLVATVTLTVDGAAVASPSPTVAGAAAQTRGSATPTPGAGVLHLGSDGVLPHPGGRVLVQKWKVHTLYYYDALPAKWDWSLKTAVAKWNTAGGRIRLVRVLKAKNAQVRIGYANIGSAAGQASVGATKHAFVRLSSRFASTDSVNARNRVLVMNVLAHELGHVLGFQHTSARCSLMSAVIDVDGCNVVPATQPGYYKCRTLDIPLVQRFIRLYGGRARYPSAGWCLIDPLPQALTGVTFTGGTSAPVTLHWNRPTSYPAGSSLVVRRWQAATCTTVPTSAATFRPSMTAGVWQDQVTYDEETACFRVQLVNRYGAGQAAVSRALARWVPALDAPVIGIPSYDFDAGEFVFTVTLPPGATLRARWDSTSPSTCVTSPTGGTDSAFVPVVDGHGSLASPSVLPQCVSFFAVDPERDRVSTPVFVTLDRVDTTAPAAPVIEQPVWDPVRPAFLAPANYPEGTHLVYDVSEDPQGCPGAYTHGQSVAEDEATMGEGVVAFMTADPDQCVSFYAVDDISGAASDPTTVVVHAPLPTETPGMGPITMLEKNTYPWREAEFTGVSVGDHIGYAVIGGSCPQSAPTVLRWRTQLQDALSDPPGRAGYGLFPSVAADVNCLVWTSLDRWGLAGARTGDGTSHTDRHGPVSMREFVDEGPLPPTVGTPVWNAAHGTFRVPVSNARGLKVIYDPADPTTCPPPGTPGAQAVSAMPLGDEVELTPPTAQVCLTFYNDAGEGPVPVGLGTPVQLTVPSGG